VCVVRGERLIRLPGCTFSNGRDARPRSWSEGSKLSTCSTLRYLKHNEFRDEQFRDQFQFNVRQNHGSPIPKIRGTRGVGVRNITITRTEDAYWTEDTPWTSGGGGLLDLNRPVAQWRAPPAEPRAAPPTPPRPACCSTKPVQQAQHRGTSCPGNPSV
jgi:hypothetical protein